MTGFSNILAGFLHEVAKNPALESGMAALVNDILAAFTKHAAATATTVDDSMAAAAKVLVPLALAHYVGVKNGANGDN